MNAMHALMMPLSGVKSRLFIVLLTIFLITPAHVEALGFGALSLSSHLNQALKADIPMLLNDADDMKAVRVELATPKEYEQLGLQWHPDLLRIRVLIQNRSSNHPIVQLRSTGLIDAPMLSIALKANKSGRGTYFKHYKLMLDPVERAQGSAQSSPSPLLPLEVLSLKKSQSSPGMEVDWARTWRYGPVQTGDSLSEIAYRLRIDKRFSNKQVMLSLYEKNRAAFVDGNINRLIKGAWLEVPRADVVKQYGGSKSMQKISKLMQGTHSTTKSRVKTSAQTDSAAVKAAAPVDHGLRYSGKIALNDPSTVHALNAVSELRSDMGQQFESLHKVMMNGKLQMTSLDETISTLSLSMQGVKTDIHRMQKDIEMIKTRTQALSAQESSWLNWQFILIVVLLVALICMLLMLMMQRKTSPDKSAAYESPKRTGEQDHGVDSDHRRQVVAMKDRQHARPDTAAKGSTIDSDDEGKHADPKADSLSDDVTGLLNQIEEELGQCHYEKAEQLLTKVDSQSPDSLKASALKAQLYHETARFDERNALINQLSERSDEARWERFCYFLPTHVWNACFGDSLSSDDTQQSA